MIWIVVNSTAIFVDLYYFLGCLSLVNGFLVPLENQESWGKKEPDASSALTSVEVEDHKIPYS